MTQRARRRHRRRRHHPSKIILIVLGVVAVGLAAAGLGIGMWVQGVVADAGSIDDLKPIDKGETTKILAADGSRLGYIRSDTIRQEISGRDMPDDLRNATVAIEDARFYEHGPIDIQAIVRAAVKNIEAGHTVEGGSTITQQLVRNLYIAEPEETLARKIKEAYWATQYEDEYTKDQILHQYLNTAPYGTVNGSTAIGVQAASELYFSKPAKDLDLPEAAMIAGLPQAPSEFNPLINPKAAISRRNDVLDAMADNGYISQEEADAAKEEGLGINPSDRYSTVREPYFFDYVQQQLIDRYGVNTVRQGGLTVHTTIDPNLQQVAQSAIDSSPYVGGSGPSGALVSINPSDGAIVAMASSADYGSNQYNLAAQGNRQPGSSFKPFVLATAIEQGIDPDSTYYNGTAPKTLDTGGGSTWTVNNAEPGGGTMSLTAATTHSVNAVYAQVGLDVGPENFDDMAHKLGITSPLDGYPAEAIGGLRIGVSPLEMADAYATFADGGVHHKPTAITSVDFPNGDEDTLDKSSGDRAISDGVAYEVTRVLKTVVTSGTGTNANYGCPVAGKTGTTDNFTDAWFVGYTPKLSTAVWVGYPQGKISMGYSAFGGTYAAPIWHNFMSVASNGYCGDFPYPQNLPSLSPFYSDHAVTGSSTGEGDFSTGGGGGGGGDHSGDGGNQYDSGAYAPGAGQEPAPPIDTGGGGGGGGGGDVNPGSPAPSPEPAPPISSPPDTGEPPQQAPDGGTGTG
jgi:penicillin-binding protein 1A